MFKNHRNRSHNNTTEAATEVLGEDVASATESITNGSSPHRNLSTLPRDCSPAQNVVPEASKGAAAEGSVSHSTRELTVHSSKSRPSQFSSDSREREDDSKLQFKLKEAAPRTYTILVSAEWDVTRLGESEFSDLVGVFYEEAAPKMVDQLSGRGLPDAEEVVQEIFLEILESNEHRRRTVMDFFFHRLRCESRFKSALRRQIRRGSRELFLLDEHAELFGVEDRGFERSKAVEELHEALSRLSPSHRLVLVLHHLESKSLKEVAAICRKSVPCIKSLLFRARLEACVALRRIREIPDSPRNQSIAQSGSTLKPTSRRH